MDQRGSLVDTNVKIYPSKKFIAFIETIPISGDVPINILRYIKDNAEVSKKERKNKADIAQIQFTNTDIENLIKIKEAVTSSQDNPTSKECLGSQKETSISDENDKNVDTKDDNKERPTEVKKEKPSEEDEDPKEEKDDSNTEEKNDVPYLTTSDIDWVYNHINKRKNKGEQNVPYLHELFQGTEIAMPENRVIKRNPVLEARCVKLRAQQEAREYRKMTKGVDNVRMRFPEDSISYQLKQINRQLIAIGQFVLSIFAGFLFGFRGIEWMIGNLDFGVRLLLGVMCALIIALAEIYFLAKKLNEELAMTETVQLGGPPKFANQPDYRVSNPKVVDSKEHQD